MARVFSDDVTTTSFSNQRLGINSSDAFQRNQEIHHFEEKCRNFLLEWRKNETFIYREKLKANYRSAQYSLAVDFTDFAAFDKQLSDRLVLEPNIILPHLEKAALQIVSETMIPKPTREMLHSIQIKITNFQRKESIRSLRSDKISKLISVTGIVTSCYKVQSKATTIKIKCASCNDIRTLKCPKGFGTADVPRVCNSRAENRTETDCELDPFVILPDECEFIDTQRLRLQELPEDVPTGEIPCNVSLMADRSLVNLVVAGTRITVVGIYSVFQPRGKNSRKNEYGNLRLPYIRVIGIESESESSSLTKNPFSPSEEEKFRLLSRDPNLYEKLAQSLAPKIYGHSDIKKAIVCLLFSGTKKVLPSRSRIRGDINILLLGDPSVAKSQLLKCTQKTAPIAVYTSGKGASAAGLTASIVHDAGGDFRLEGGAMVLADGGCVCVDEFDKMREEDRVAIHEAMEQQTISIAKAGITTMLNSRTAVLAAANPTFGRYDDFKKAAENIDFETTILSRFDLIFIIRDKKDTAKDEKLSKHLLGIHMQRETDENPPSIEPSLFTRYISFCRENCTPRLSEDAAELLKNRYVAFRVEAKKRLDEQGIGAIPITVRQLEAIVRLAEALAKLELCEIATVDHVKEALRLFSVATMAAVSAEGETESLFDEGQSDFLKAVQRAERHLKRRLPIGTRWSFARIVKELVARNHTEGAVLRAVHAMRSRGELESSGQGKLITRKK